MNSDAGMFFSLGLVVGGFVMFMVCLVPWLMPEYECERINNVYDCNWATVPAEGEN